MKYILQLLFFFLLATSCSGGRQLDETLAKAEILLNTAPQCGLLATVWQEVIGWLAWRDRVGV